MGFKILWSWVTSRRDLQHLMRDFTIPQGVLRVYVKTLNIRSHDVAGSGHIKTSTRL